MATTHHGPHTVRNQPKTTTPNEAVITANVNNKWVMAALGILFAAVFGLFPYISSEVGGLRKDISTEVGSLRTEMIALRAEMKADYRHLDNKVDRLQSDMNDIKSELKLLSSFLLKDKRNGD